jgi:hypothetical protein
MESISSFNVDVLKEIENLNLHDFGIYLELEPDEEEKGQLEQNIQIALQSGGIDLDDAIDIRQIKNLKLANQLLKLKRRRNKKLPSKLKWLTFKHRHKQTQRLQKEQLWQVQKQQALTQEKVSIEQAKSQFEIQRMQTEAQIKKELMAEEFNYQMQLAQIRANAEKTKEQDIEDRKDKRVKIQGTQQSELIDQRKNDTLPKNFESAGNDTLGGFNLEQFSPK